MIGIITTMLAAWLLMALAPGTPIARWLHATFVVAPAARLNRLTRGHVALAAIAVAVIGTVAWAGEGDLLRMLGMAAPEAVTWLTTVEVAAYLDVAIAAIAAWSAARLRLPVVLAGLRRTGARRRRDRSVPAARHPANDDGEVDRRRCA